MNHFFTLFLDLIPRGDGSVIAAVADVAGKGVAASLVMASVKSVLPMIAATESVPETMRRLNEKLTRELSKREFVALACASYEPSTRRLILANAGLPDPPVSEDEPLGYDRFAAIAAASHASLETLDAAVEAESRGARNDDWTAVLLEV